MPTQDPLASQQWTVDQVQMYRRLLNDNEGSREAGITIFGESTQRDDEAIDIQSNSSVPRSTFTLNE